DGEMKSYSSTLIVKPSPAHDGMNETKQRFRKVSLVTNHNKADFTKNSINHSREEGVSATEGVKSDSVSQPLPVSSLSSAGRHAEDAGDNFSRVYTATRVELLTDSSPSSSPVTSNPGSPFQNDMEILVDTLKSMNPPQRQRSLRGSTAPSIFSSLPPIVEDAPCHSPSQTKSPEVSPGSPQEGSNSFYNFPVDLGLKWGTPRDTRSPLELMKEQQGNLGGLNLPFQASAVSNVSLRKWSVGSESSPESSPSPLTNGGSSSQTPSRLDNSILFSSYRSASMDQPRENGKAHSPASSSQDRMSSDPVMGMAGGLGSGLGFGSGIGIGTGTDPLIPSRYERFSFLIPTSSSMDIHNPEPEMNPVPKFRAFPDAYLTKEKEHGKLNPRPGKMFIFDRPGMCGQRIEVRSDIVDATPWELQETISIRVVRGGWVLYEKPNFKGEKIALHEGDVEITYPFNLPEPEEPPQQQDGQNGQNGEKEEGGEEVVVEAEPVRKFIIGSIRRAVRDYSVPEISLFPEENAEGKKVTFRDTSDDARIFGFPIKANSIIINAGLWLVYAQPFFQGAHRVLEVGGYPNPASWGVEQPYVGSVHPLKIGEPKVEKPSEPKLVLYEKPYFTGKTRTIYTNMRDFMTRLDKQQMTFMYSAGSIKVQGGCWVGYEKEGFRGHQYLLEEGEYHDWRVWGGHNSELRSVRVIRADLTEPMLVMSEQPDADQESQEKTFEVTEAIPDVELFGYRTATSSIHVLSGAWIAYSHVDFSGDQYILEKGFYGNCADWGSTDNRICSVQPILLVSRGLETLSNGVMLYTEPDFQGECHVCDKDQESLSDQLVVKSCRVVGGSWAVYEGRQYSGNLYVLSEGDYPNFTSMACPPNCVIRSLKTVPLVFSVPSISLFGLECFEGREITMDMEVANMLEEGYNNHILSVRVNRGCWVLCEHSNYRGRQFLLEPIEITNWGKFSHLVTIGSMYPIRQRRHFFRIKNKAQGHFLSIQGGVEEMKSGRVVATEQVEGMSDVWFYQDGLIKNKLAPTMSLQVMGNVEAGSKLVLWSETRQPVQTWTAHMTGTVASLTFPGMVLDIKGGKQYDRDHIVIQPASEDRPCQQWELELL
uniref:Beta/gamma crystallin 'Greek key' domain-containing protein n=1 Tax=Esox lucius TaxID=8010 RepID=A0A3P8ZA16_ESOLU